MKSNESPIIRNVRAFEIPEISDKDLDKASQIPANECPRRYCWWWHTLSFDWEIEPSDGCLWMQADKPSSWHFKDVPCCRADTESKIDHFETRGPHIEGDGIDPSRWIDFLRDNQKQFSSEDAL